MHLVHYFTEWKETKLRTGFVSRLWADTSPLCCSIFSPWDSLTQGFALVGVTHTHLLLLLLLWGLFPAHITTQVAPRILELRPFVNLIYNNKMQALSISPAGWQVGLEWETLTSVQETSLISSVSPLQGHWGTLCCKSLGLSKEGLQKTKYCGLKTWEILGSYWNEEAKYNISSLNFSIKFSAEGTTLGKDLKRKSQWTHSDDKSDIWESNDIEKFSIFTTSDPRYLTVMSYSKSTSFRGIKTCFSQLLLHFAFNFCGPLILPAAMSNYQYVFGALLGVLNSFVYANFLISLSNLWPFNIILLTHDRHLFHHVRVGGFLCSWKSTWEFSGHWNKMKSNAHKDH